MENTIRQAPSLHEASAGGHGELKTSPKDFFLHLLSIIALYMSVGSLLTLLFQYINVLFPDPLAYQSYGEVAGLIRYAMASLIIMFPVYIWISRILNREYEAMPEKKEYRFRKWLVYLTLFLAGVTIIIDLIVLIYNFLGGELTMRFILKIIAVLLVAGVVFWYYQKDLKNALSAKQVKNICYGVCIFLLASLVFGFFTAGSPIKARLYNFDERKISDLSVIQGQIINYWQRKEMIPNNLGELTDSISGFTAPLDPQTNEAYEYIVKGQTNFELCANFNLPTNFGLIGKSVSIYPRGVYGPYDENWNHEIGRQCFERTIDPALYPKIKPVN